MLQGKKKMLTPCKYLEQSLFRLLSPLSLGCMDACHHYIVAVVFMLVYTAIHSILVNLMQVEPYYDTTHLCLY